MSELKRITDISSFFKHENNKWIFVSKKLEVYIPKVYEEKDLAIIGDDVTTIGIIQLRIDDTYFANIMFLSKLTIEYLSYRNETEDNFKYIVLELQNGSAFIKNSSIVKNSNSLYDIFTLFLAHGKLPPFLTYDDIYKLFDNDSKHCGVSLKINHSVFEMIYAHIFRDKKDPFLPYRLTSMTEKPIIVPLHQISHGPISTTSKIVGGYLTEGITSALVDDTERIPSKIENLLRS